MSLNDKLNKTYRSFPKAFNAANNPVLNALIKGFAGEDYVIQQQLENTKAQLFVKTAEGKYLNKLAASRGVLRPSVMGLTDADFRNLIPNLSLKAKQIRKTFYDTMDVFWGTQFSRANVTAVNYAPYNLSVGNVFKFKVDGGSTQSIKILTGDIATPGAATISEIQTILARATNISTTYNEDPITSSKYLVIRTNTPGLKGSIEIVSSSAFGASKVDMALGKYELWQQAQRTVIYEINPNEIIIEIPATVPALRRTLRGSHHFHADKTIESPVAPDNGIWQGSFIFDPSGTVSSYTVSGQNAIIQETLVAGQIYTKVTVDSIIKFLDTSGVLIFGMGTSSEEYPVQYRGIPNSNTVLLDSSHVFANRQLSGTSINVLTSQIPKEPRKNGDDLAIYMTSPESARVIVQDLLGLLTAAGVILTFVILVPKFTYIIDNPYLTDDDEPKLLDNKGDPIESINDSPYKLP